MRISVCMGVYNGAEYIEEQLRTILNQTLPPDEVILVDDGSTDATVEIIERVAKEHPAGSCIHFARNTENKGYPANFYYAQSLCSGDLVFLADQDDVWDLRKIERMAGVFADESVQAVCCEVGLIDAEGEEIHRGVGAKRRKTKEHGGNWAGFHNQVRKDSGDAAAKPVALSGLEEFDATKNSVNPSGIVTHASCETVNKNEDADGMAGRNLTHITLHDVFRASPCPGMAMAYRRSWYDSWSKGSYAIPHDLLLQARAAEDGGFVRLPEVLAYHRRHDHNTGEEEHRIGKLLQKDRKVHEITTYLKHLEGFRTAQVLTTSEGKRTLDDKEQVMRERLEALESGSARKVIKNAWKNRREMRWVTAVCDVLIAWKG